MTHTLDLNPQWKPQSPSKDDTHSPPLSLSDAPHLPCVFSELCAHPHSDPIWFLSCVKPGTLLGGPVGPSLGPQTRPACVTTAPRGHCRHRRWRRTRRQPPCPPGEDKLPPVPAPTSPCGSRIRDFASETGSICWAWKSVLETRWQNGQRSPTVFTFFDCKELCSLLKFDPLPIF